MQSRNYLGCSRLLLDRVLPKETKKGHEYYGCKGGQELNKTQALLIKHLDDAEQLVRLSAEVFAREGPACIEDLKEEGRNQPWRMQSLMLSSRTIFWSTSSTQSFPYDRIAGWH